MEGRRKLIGFGSVLVAACAFLIANKLTGGQFVELIWKTSSVFFAANAAEWLTRSRIRNGRNHAR